MMKAKTYRIPLRVVFYKEGASWVAHCLEFDLCGDGASRSDALACLAEAIAVQVKFSVEHGNLKNLFSPAPSDIQEMFFSGKATGIGEIKLKMKEIDGVVFEDQEYREYSGGRSSLGSDLMPA
jgi:predicted RNase H-like HicB family nuclease